MIQSKVFILMEEYEAGERSAKRLLKACTNLVRPAELSH